MRRSVSYLLNERAIFKRENLRLAEQARILFDLEYPVLRRLIGRRPGTLLDAGCGNGAYLARLARRFPHLAMVGIDRHPRLLAAARLHCPRATFLRCEITDRAQLTEVVAKQPPQVVLLRFVIQHMSADERALAFETLHRVLPARTKLIIIEPDPDTFATTPPSPAIQYLAARVSLITEARGADRRVVHHLPHALRAFSNLQQIARDTGSRALGWRNAARVHMPILATRITRDSSDFEATQLSAARRWIRQASKLRGSRLASSLIFTICERT
ncbi:MAG: class I SAM-dependent methyltransferase [Myxococcales bacterium]|nr:class I SAM-dependent methyltransferase [Myxococcales bacterium]